MYIRKPRNQWELDCLDAHVDADNDLKALWVEVFSENLISGNKVINCACSIVFVAVDEQGNKRKLQVIS